MQIQSRLQHFVLRNEVSVIENVLWKLHRIQQHVQKGFDNYNIIISLLLPVVTPALAKLYCTKSCSCTCCVPDLAFLNWPLVRLQTIKQMKALSGPVHDRVISGSSLRVKLVLKNSNPVKVNL